MLTAMADEARDLAPFAVVALVVLVAVWGIGAAQGKGMRSLLWAGLVVCVAAILWATLGSVIATGDRGTGGLNLVPFQEIQRGIDNQDTSAWRNVVGNIVMFVPFGLVIALLGRGGIWVRLLLATVVGATFSTVIELTQYWAGRVADIDDIILNTTGALLGAVVGAVIGGSVEKARRARAARS
ncbi:VanZ family protein [Demequina sp.]|uniref:VanZ family protein n=1 Tax=Demequina sp. TaxID=2050685 RepID=UPI003A8741BA